MGQKAGSFYRIMNKEQGGGKQMISDWLGPHISLFGVRRNKDVRGELRGGSAFGDWLSGYTASLGKRHIYGDTRVT